MIQTVEEIINKIDIIVGNEWKFEMDDIYEVDIPHPPISTLDTLYWKRNTKGLRSVPALTTEKKDELIEIISNIPEIYTVEITTTPFGCYIVVELTSIHNTLLYQYNKYLDFEKKI